MRVVSLGEEGAVSPVIGTVLMVAITVIISAVIATYVFNMGNVMTPTHSVGASAERQLGTTITVTWQGGLDNSNVLYYNITLTPSDSGNPALYPHYPPIVGNATRFGGGTTDSDHVVVTAVFTDNSEQVVLDTSV
jgi:flagellin-like protein